MASSGKTDLPNSLSLDLSVGTRGSLSLPDASWVFQRGDRRVIDKLKSQNHRSNVSQRTEKGRCLDIIDSIILIISIATDVRIIRS